MYFSKRKHVILFFAVSSILFVSSSASSSSSSSTATTAVTDNRYKDEDDGDHNSIRGSSDNHSHHRQRRRDQECGECPEEGAVSRSATFNTRESIFDQLNSEEYASLVEYITGDETNIAESTMDDIDSSNKAFNRNYIVFMQLFPPPKIEAIAYLDGDTNNVPDRYAIVTIHRGRERPRDVMQYKIGPIVNGEVQTKNTVVEKLLKDNELPWAQRGNYSHLKKYVEDQVFKQAYVLRNLFRATTGGYCFGGNECNGGDDMKYIEYANLATTPEKRITNIHFILKVPNGEFGPSCLLPVPISFHIIENPDVDPSEWETTNFEYCYQGPYSSAQALLDAITNDEVQQCTLPTSNVEWTSTDPVQPFRQDATIKEPISYHSSGKRYVIDKGSDGAGHRVSWLGWTFHIASDQMHGMVVRNLSFKGERLAYELNFQEFFASYSGMGGAGQTVYFDSNWEIGSYSALELGLDCPEDATLLPIIQHDNGAKAEVSHNLMCIFEQPTGEAMWRHELSKSNRVAGIPRTLLKIRVVSVMGNYDYIPTLSLMADGVMKVDVEMGGYLQAGYSADVTQDENQESPFFGTRLHNNMAGLLHDHIIGVKADLDIGGVQNTLMAGKVKYGTYEEATGGKSSKPGSHAYNGVKYMNWTTIDTERGISAKDYDTIMIASQTKNKWGSQRSYEIAFDHTIPSQVFPPDHPVAAATAWQYSNVAITRQKDSERYCSFPSNYQIGTAFPSFDLREFQQQGDDVINEDLVFWIMFGVQHYPKAEDVPLVSNFGSGFVLKPRNMYDRAAFEDLPDNRDVKHPVCIAPSIFNN
jgi:hypothetical protein